MVASPEHRGQPASSPVLDEWPGRTTPPTGNLSTVRILLVRHGEAAAPEAFGTDGLRGLTTAGRTSLRRLAARLSEGGHAPRWIYTSPLVRAVQSAEVLAAGAWYHDGLPVQIEVLTELAPGEGSSAELMERSLAAPDEPLALIGHEPGIRLLAAHLLGDASLPAFRQGEALLLAWDAASDRGSLLTRFEPST